MGKKRRRIHAASQQPDEPCGKHIRSLSSPTSNVNTNQNLEVMNSSSDSRKQKIKEAFVKLHNLKEVINGMPSAKLCSDEVWKKYRSLNKNVKGNDIVAGFIVCEHLSTSKIIKSARVVAIGSGTKCLGGDKLQCDGLVINNSHAEVVAHRSLVRWLYSQLQRAGQDDSIATRNTKPFRLRSFDLWFYTSQTPCGDSAVYSYKNK